MKTQEEQDDREVVATIKSYGRIGVIYYDGHCYVVEWPRRESYRRAEYVRSVEQEEPERHIMIDTWRLWR